MPHVEHLNGSSKGWSRCESGMRVPLRPSNPCNSRSEFRERQLPQYLARKSRLLSSRTEVYSYAEEEAPALSPESDHVVETFEDRLAFAVRGLGGSRFRGIRSKERRQIAEAQ